MTTFVILLRAVNVGGTGKLPMSELKAMCERAGLDDVRTYIASGNVVCRSSLSKARVKALVETALEDYAGKPVGVAVRTAAEMAAVLAGNPFPSAQPNQTAAIFLDAAPPADLLDHVSGQKNETIAPGKQEIYVHYPDGMGRSKLKIAAAKAGTARNMNTVATLAEWAAS
jgi:uncharacterized protein (DUF1697 family)